MQGLIEINAASVWLSLTNGAQSIQQIESATNLQDDFVVNFAQAVKSTTQVQFELPQDYNGGNVTVTFVWSANSASGNSVVWGAQLAAFASGSVLDEAYGTAQEVTSANSGTLMQNVSAATAPITIAGTPAPGARCKLQIYRLGSGADNLAAAAMFLQAQVRYTRVLP